MATTKQNIRPRPVGNNRRDSAQSPPLGGRQAIRVASLSASSLNHAIINKSAPRRAPIPQRNESNPQLPAEPQSHSYFDYDEDDESWWKNVVREQIDVQSLRDMAKFFRTTEPPSLGSGRASIETQRNCFGAAVNMENKKRWSIQSLRRGKRVIRDSEDESSTPLSQLPDSAVRSTSVGGHDYIAISVPSRLSLPPSSLLEMHLESRSPLPGQPSTLLENNQKQGTEPDRASEGNNSGDRSSLLARDSTLRYYGTMLRLLGSSPVDEDGIKTTTSLPATTDEEEKDIKKVLDSPGEATYISDQPEKIEKTEERPPPLRSTPSYSTIPRPSSSSKWSLRNQSASHSRAVSLTAEASKGIRRREEPFPTTASSRGKTKPEEEKTHNSSPESSSSLRKHSHSSQPSKDRKPGNILVVSRSLLQIPQQEAALLTPESPGFPKMLAAMTFPAPPENFSSHQSKNSVSYHETLSSSSILTPQMGSATTAIEEGKSLPSPATSIVSKGFITTGAEEEEIGGRVRKTATESGSYSDLGEMHPTSKPKIDTADDTSPKEPRQSYMSTTSNTDLSETTTMDSRYSMLSDTTVTSNATATRNKDDHHYRSKSSLNHSKSHGSLDILSKKRSRWSLLSENKDISIPDQDEFAKESRDSSPNDLQRMNPTKKDTRSALAERRRERRRKVREKIQTDLSTSLEAKSNKNLNVIPCMIETEGVGQSHAVDSPVLGYFSGNTTPIPILPLKEGRNCTASAREKRLVPRPSPLATSFNNADTQVVDILGTGTDEDASGNGNERPTSIDSTTPNYRNLDLVGEAGPPNSPRINLCISPIMVAASIDPGPMELSTPTPILVTPTPARPLSLVYYPPPKSGSSSGESERHHGADQNRRVIRQRPVPIRISRLLTDENSARILSVAGENTPDSATGKGYRQSLPSALAPSSLETYVGKALTVAATTMGSNRPQSLPPASQHSLHERSTNGGKVRPSLDDTEGAAASLLTQDDERRWLQAYQRQSVHEWRQAAWRERERVQLQHSPKGEDEMVGETNPTTRNSRLSWAIEDMTNMEAVSDRRNSTVEERLRRLERNGNEWSDMVIPLLEKMNHLLSEIHRGSMSGHGTESISQR